MNWITSNWELILEVVGAASVLAAIFARLTKNKTDDKLVAALQKLLDFTAINPERKAEEAGEAAVEANPGEGADSVVGTPRDLN